MHQVVLEYQDVAGARDDLVVGVGGGGVARIVSVFVIVIIVFVIIVVGMEYCST